MDFIWFWSPGTVFTEYYSWHIMYKFLMLQCNMTCYTLLPEKYKLWKETVITVKRLENKHSKLKQRENYNYMKTLHTNTYQIPATYTLIQRWLKKSNSNRYWATWVLDHLGVKTSETCDRYFLKIRPKLDQKLNTNERNCTWYIEQWNNKVVWEIENNCLVSYPLHCLGMKTS